MDSILARLDDRLRKFSGTEGSGKQESGEIGKKEQNGNHSWSSEGVKSSEGKAEDVVDNWAPPDLALMIHTDTVVRSTKSIESVYVEVSTSLDHGTRYESTL